MGNSEVGHSTIGSGRILPQMLTRINNSFIDGSFEKNKHIVYLANKIQSNSQTIHLAGLYSSGGIHSEMDHLHKIIKILGSNGKKIVLHLFSDGRDVPTDSFVKDIKELCKACSGYDVRIGTIIGRYYAMDRNNRKERTKIAFDAITFGKGDNNIYIQTQENQNLDSRFVKSNQRDIERLGLGLPVNKENIAQLSKIIKGFYNKQITDEFIRPLILNDFNGLNANDDIFFFNFRPDRMAQIVKKFVSKRNDFNTEIDNDNINSKNNELKNNNAKISNINIITMVDYFSGKMLDSKINTIFCGENIHNVLGSVVDYEGIAQFRIAETEKYPHITYFFNAGRELPFEKENRFLVPSPDVETYDVVPQMSALKVRDELVNAIKSEEYGFAVVNFANCDMVGHTGNFEASVKAVECVDEMLGSILAVAEDYNWEVIITADHGNVETMLDLNGKIHTQHTLNKVPFIGIGSFLKSCKLNDGTLCDIAPTILEIMKIEIPSEMTGKSLIKKNSD